MFVHMDGAGTTVGVALREDHRGVSSAEFAVQAEILCVRVLQHELTILETLRPDGADAYRRKAQIGLTGGGTGSGIC